MNLEERREYLAENNIKWEDYKEAVATYQYIAEDAKDWTAEEIAEVVLDKMFMAEENTLKQHLDTHQDDHGTRVNILIELLGIE